MGEVFVCGPSAFEIDELMENSTSPFTTTLVPKVIYAIENKENCDSRLSKDIVPKLCFPLDVETSIQLGNERLRTRTEVRAVNSCEGDYELHKDSGNLNNTTANRQGIRNKEISNKRRNLLSTETKERNRVNSNKKNSNHFISEMGGKRFVTLFTDDKSNISFGIVFVVNRVFKKKSKNIDLITQYCMCIVSDYPFI